MKLTSYQRKFFEDNPDIVWPLCKCGCGNRVLLDYSNANAIFRMFASATCSRKSKTISAEVTRFLSDKEWVYNQRITLRKPIETIAKELGVSPLPVKKWLERHGLGGIRYNESVHRVQQILNSKEILETDYSTGKTLSELAEEYGTSASTLSRFFTKHGIKTREPNSYDRSCGSSGEETQLVEWVKTITNDKIIQSSRQIIPPLEIDILIPSKRIAIEYNGLYSHIYRPHEHNNSLKKGPDYHLGKLEKCSDKGYHLIHIFSDQWKKQRTAVKTVLMAKLGCNTKIHGRNCSVREIDTGTKNTFLDTFHLQGADRSSIKLGLFNNTELVAVMSFGRPRFNKKYTWELIRYSGKLGITVVGGFSKLLKYFINTYSDLNDTIISYADRCLSNGNVYIKNGFILKHVNRPSYHYVIINTETRTPRTTFTKKQILHQLNLEHSSKSESELADDLGLNKIYDCGTLTFVYTV